MHVKLTTASAAGKRRGDAHLVFLSELQDAVDEVLPALLEQQVTVFILTDRCQTADVKSFKDQMSQDSSEPLSKDLRSHLTLRSPAAYIYTSGTTGEFPQVQKSPFEWAFVYQ